MRQSFDIRTGNRFPSRQGRPGVPRFHVLAFVLLAGTAALAGCSTGDESRAGWSVYEGGGHCETPTSCELVAKSGRGVFNLSAQGEGPDRDFFGFYSSDVAPGTYSLEWSGPRAEQVEVSIRSLETPCGELDQAGVQAVAEPDRCAVRFQVDSPLRADGSTTLRWSLSHRVWDRSANFERDGPVLIQFKATRVA